MVNTTLLPHSPQYFLWHVILELGTNTPITTYGVRQRLRTLARHSGNPDRQRWARVMLARPRLDQELRRLATLHLLTSQRAPGLRAVGGPHSLVWNLQAGTHVVVPPSTLETGEAIRILEALDSWLAQHPANKVNLPEMHALIQQIRQIHGGDTSVTAATLALEEMIESRLINRVTPEIAYGPSPHFRPSATGQSLLYDLHQQRLHLNPRAASADIALVSLEEEDTPPATARASALSSLSGHGALIAERLLEQPAPGVNEETALWAILHGQANAAAEQSGDNPSRLLNEAVAQLLRLATQTMPPPDQPGPSHAGNSPFFSTSFVNSLREHLSAAHDLAGRETAGVFQRMLPPDSGTMTEQDAHELLLRASRQVGYYHGLDSDTLLLLAAGELAGPPATVGDGSAGRFSPDLLQTLFNDMADIGPPATGMWQTNAQQRVLVLEIEPDPAHSIVERATELRMAHYPPRTERYRLRQGGLWQRWHDGAWELQSGPLLFDPARMLKIVLVGEGQSHSARDDSNRIGGRYGEELAQHLAELLPPGTWVKRLSLLACRPGLGLIQSLLEALHLAGIGVVDVVRRRGPVLLAPGGRSWVAVDRPNRWLHGHGTREIVTLDPASGVLEVRPDTGARPDSLQTMPQHAAGPLGALPLPAESLLDGRLWRGRMSDALDRLSQEHETPRDWLPALASLRSDGDGQRLRLLSPSGDETRDIVTRDPLWTGFATHLDRRLASLYETAQASWHASQRAFGYSLGLAMLLQARGDTASDDPLDRALRLHAELGRIQFTHGALGDVALLTQHARDLLRDGRTLARSSRFAQTLGDGLGLASRGLGPLLGLANAGFDIYEIMHAQTPAEQALFATQLGFDATILTIEGGAIVATATGAGLVAEVAGPVGLAIGLIGFAITSAMAASMRHHALVAAEEAVEAFFARLAAAHQGDGCDYAADSDTLQPRPGLVVTRLDLGRARIEFGSQYVMATRLVASRYIDPDLVRPQELPTHVPQMMDDPARALSLRERLGMPSQADLLNAQARHIVLPATPDAVIRYRYQRVRKPYTPLPTTVASNPGYQAMRRIGADGDFYPEWAGMAIVNLQFEYRDTGVEVVLGPAPRIVSTPALAADIGPRLKYDLLGAGGRYLVTLSAPTAGYRLETLGNTPSEWLLDLTSLGEAAVTIDDASTLHAGTTPIVVPAGGDTIALRLAGGELRQFDRTAGLLRLLALDAASAVPSPRDDQALLALLAARNCAEWVLIENAPPNGAERAYFHAPSRRLLRPGATPSQRKGELLRLESGSAVYVDRHASALWRCDDAGRLLATMPLLLEGEDSRIAAIEHQQDGIVFEQQIGPPDKAGLILRYRLKEGASPLLIALECTLSWPASLAAADFAHWLARAAGRESAPGRTAMEGSLPAGLATWVVRRAPAGAAGTQWWQPIEGRVLEAFGQDLPSDLILAAAQSSGMYFYSPSRRLLYHQTGRSDAQCLPLPAITRIAHIEDTLLLIASDGVVRRLVADGRFELQALTRTWFAAHRHDWWRALPALGDEDAAFGHENTLPLPPVVDAAERERGVWYDCLRRRFVIAPAVAGADTTRFIGIDAAGSAWLLDTATGTLCAQAPLEPEWAASLFDSEGRLVSEISLQALARFSGENFVDAAIVGGRLQATSDGGLLLKLDAAGRCDLVAVGQRWLERVPRGARQESMRALAPRYPHPEVIRLGNSEHSPVSWYRPASDSLIVPDMAVAPRYIGYASAQRSAFYFDRANGLMRMQRDRFSTLPDRLYRDAWRGGRWLLLRGIGAEGGDLRPLALDGVERVWLAGEGDERYRVDATAWNALHEIVIDDYAANGQRSTLKLDFAGAGELSVTECGDDLLLRAAGGKRILLRHALSANDPHWRWLIVRFDGDHGPLALARLANGDFDRSGRLTLAQARAG
ncbi:TcdA/TcdB pore-forming domain-containing protein [Paludibacterium yongneupense]|uniref:TcdA/TcdB pore-forming domain-containing protein n=1 Tax=Paludibacterium yongneupense TaxID=400061 RepID=UPI0004252846|nr:TcdA/TcdB pore-forming domain-containing protein [Paludibacterium yongneupense]